MSQSEKNQKNLIEKPPVVVLLGHIDHGKSSLLEAIKDFKITQKESGGITQHIGAYQVDFHNKKITFIDTPGHEAFSAIRSRGATVADVAVLVVAAVEGVKPQTKEAIKQAKKANVSIIVALNKMDKKEAQPEKVKRELVNNGLLIEEFGGDVPVVETSAIKKQGINELLEMILLVSQMKNLKTSLSAKAEGTVIEACLDSQKGPVATVIPSKGIFNLKDIVATSSTFGKIKAMQDFQGNSLNKGLPSQPIVILGLNKVPIVGEILKTFPDIESAKNYAIKKEEQKAKGAVLLEPKKKLLNLVIKADAYGSLEAINKIIEAIQQDKVAIRILKSGVGDINESDVKLAAAGSAKIIGFRVNCQNLADRLAQTKNVKIVKYDIIYEIVQEIRRLMQEITRREIVREDVGRIEVLVIFRTKKNRQIIGGRVINGQIEKGLNLEIIRQEEKIGEGKLLSLQKEKKDIKIAKPGDEVGILYEGNAKISVGDVLVAYIKRQGVLK